MAMKMAISTYLLVMFVVSISGFTSYYDSKSMNWHVASLFINWWNGWDVYSEQTKR